MINTITLGRPYAKAAFEFASSAGQADAVARAALEYEAHVRARDQHISRSIEAGPIIDRHLHRTFAHDETIARGVKRFAHQGAR